MFTYVQDRRNNCDTKCSMREISNASLGGRWMHRWEVTIFRYDGL